MSKWTESARHQQCQVGLPGCEVHQAVLAHIRRQWNAGTALKPPDYMGTFACDPCHAKLDRRTPGLTQAEIDEAFLDGHLKTLKIWESMGFL